MPIRLSISLSSSSPPILSTRALLLAAHSPAHPAAPRLRKATDLSTSTQSSRRSSKPHTTRRLRTRLCLCRRECSEVRGIQARRRLGGLSADLTRECCSGLLLRDVCACGLGALYASELHADRGHSQRGGVRKSLLGTVVRKLSASEPVRSLFTYARCYILKLLRWPDCSRSAPRRTIHPRTVSMRFRAGMPSIFTESRWKNSSKASSTTHGTSLTSVSGGQLIFAHCRHR